MLFRNYVLQHMVGLNIPEFTALLVNQLQGNFAALACNKYASNVVEKCLTESGENISTLIILELIRSPNSSLLLVDPYANFVIQSALKVSKVVHTSILYRVSSISRCLICLFITMFMITATWSLGYQFGDKQILFLIVWLLRFQRCLFWSFHLLISQINRFTIHSNILLSDYYTFK